MSIGEAGVPPPGGDPAAADRVVVPLSITARDEERALGPCLDSLLRAVQVAEEALPLRFDVVVVLDQCTDGTEAVAAARGVRCLRSHGGKVEAQRAALRGGPFHVFADADVVVEPGTLAALCRALLEDPAVQVAFPPRRPLLPRRRTLLAEALHVYNERRGFSSQRRWFSGKLFAIRRWQVPGPAEIARRAGEAAGRGMGAGAFLDLAAPLRVDDVYLSRSLWKAYGAAGLRETDGTVWFRAPETWRGMYRYYRRMRRELSRTSLLFPELGVAPSRTPDLLASATRAERRAWRIFEAALLACRVVYRLEQLACDHLGRPPGDPWPAIAETKAL